MYISTESLAISVGRVPVKLFPCTSLRSTPDDRESLLEDAVFMFSRCTAVAARAVRVLYVAGGHAQKL